MNLCKEISFFINWFLQFFDFCIFTFKNLVLVQKQCVHWVSFLICQLLQSNDSLSVLSTECFIYYRKSILQITQPSQYRCMQLQYRFAVMSEATSTCSTKQSRFFFFAAGFERRKVCLTHGTYIKW